MKRETKIKYALVLSGGGFNGAFQLGAINYINENWQKITGQPGQMKFDLIAGVSVGAINGSMLASDKLDLLNDLWLNKIAKNGVKEIYTSDFIDTDSKSDTLKMKLDFEQLRKQFVPNFKLDLGVFKKLAMVFSKGKRSQYLKDILKRLSSDLKNSFPKFRALADNTPLKEKLNQYLDKDKISGTEFICGLVSLDNGLYQSISHLDFNSNKDFVNGVLSSSCIPMVWEPISKVAYNHQSKLCVSKNNIDGGVKNVSPLGDIVQRINTDSEDCEYKIIIINCNSGTPVVEDYTNKNIVEIAARSLYDIAFTEIFNNDVKHFLKINDLLKQTEAWDSEISLFDSNNKEIKVFDSVVIQPEVGIDLGNALVANEKLIQMRLDHGNEMAQKAFNKNK